jgi:hypothetical protein
LDDLVHIAVEDAAELMTANEMAELIAADEAAAAEWEEIMAATDDAAAVEEEGEGVAAADDVAAAVPAQPRFSGLEGMIGFQG